MALGIPILRTLRSASTLIEDIHLSYTFIYDPKDEIVYTITMLLPLVYLYVFNLSDLIATISNFSFICRYYTKYF